MRFEHLAERTVTVVVITASLDLNEPEALHVRERQRDIFLKMVAQTVKLKTKRTLETCAGANLFAGPGPIIQPHIHTGRFPVVRLVENVEIAVTIQVSQPAFMPALSRH